jgi:hypothetical protein
MKQKKNQKAEPPGPFAPYLNHFLQFLNPFSVCRNRHPSWKEEREGVRDEKKKGKKKKP